MKLTALSGGFGMIANAEYAQYKRRARSHRKRYGGLALLMRFARVEGADLFN